MPSRAVAEALLSIGGVRFQPEAPITFKSGLRSPVYCDNRRFPFHPEQWRVVIAGFRDLIPTKGIRFDVVGGIEAAGIPHSAALGYALRQPSIFIRKAAKDHGTKKRVEGGDVAGKQVLLVEDLVTTGGSSLSGVEALRAEGAVVTDCLAIISYGFPEMRAAFAQAGVSLHTLTDFETVLALVLERGLLHETGAASVRAWLRDPHAWAAQQESLPGMNTVLAKYNRRVEAIGSMVCVGLDSEASRLPARFGGSQAAFNRFVIEQTAPYAAAYKPNLAFYEARGARGWEELHATMQALQELCPEALTICDAKRGDIGNTNLGYVQAIFDELHFDAVTLHPYLGREALDPFLSRADKACIILCRTSNPGAGELQDLVAEGEPLWMHIARKVSAEWDRDGHCMLVVGATYPAEMKRVREAAPRTTFLVPGIGAQGGDVRAVVEAGLDAQGRGLIISSSRALIFSDHPGKAARDLRAEIEQAREATLAAR